MLIITQIRNKIVVFCEIELITRLFHFILDIYLFANTREKIPQTSGCLLLSVPSMKVISGSPQQGHAMFYVLSPFICSMEYSPINLTTDLG